MTPSDEDILDNLFAALSDRSRRRMLMDLTRGEKSVQELGEPLGLSKQLVSKHLMVLSRAGLITKHKDGRVQRCQFNPKTFSKIQAAIKEYERFWNERFDALESYIEDLKGEQDE